MCIGGIWYRDWSSMQITDLKYLPKRCRGASSGRRSDKGSSILNVLEPKDRLLNPAFSLNRAATKLAFPAFSDGAILPLAATLIPGWRRVNWNRVGQTGADYRLRERRGKKAASPWQAVTGNAMQIDSLQIALASAFDALLDCSLRF